MKLRWSDLTIEERSERVAGWIREGMKLLGIMGILLLVIPMLVTGLLLPFLGPQLYASDSRTDPLEMVLALSLLGCVGLYIVVGLLILMYDLVMHMNLPSSRKKE